MNKKLLVIFAIMCVAQDMLASDSRNKAPKLQNPIEFKSLSIDTSFSPQSIIAISPAATTATSPKPILRSGSTPSLVNTDGSISPKHVSFRSGSALKSPSHFTIIVIDGLRNAEESADLNEVKQFVDVMCEGRRVTTQMKKETIKEFSFAASHVMSKGAGNEEETLEAMILIENALGIAKTPSTDFASDSREW